MWWSEVCEISKRLVAQVPTIAKVAGVCVGGIGPALVLCDGEENFVLFVRLSSTESTVEPRQKWPR